MLYVQPAASNKAHGQSTRRQHLRKANTLNYRALQVLHPATGAVSNKPDAEVTALNMLLMRTTPQSCQSCTTVKHTTQQNRNQPFL
jgi:hypothetical protein